VPLIAGPVGARPDGEAPCLGAHEGHGRVGKQR
jgi:hypothetical protein